jgi:hypothetical protein
MSTGTGTGSLPGTGIRLKCLIPVRDIVRCRGRQRWFGVTINSVVLFQLVADAMEAMVNMADVFSELWPMDNTPRVLLRILVHYKFAAGIRDSEVQDYSGIRGQCAQRER